MRSNSGPRHTGRGGGPKPAPVGAYISSGVFTPSEEIQTETSGSARGGFTAFRGTSVIGRSGLLLGSAAVRGSVATRGSTATRGSGDARGSHAYRRPRAASGSRSRAARGFNASREFCGSQAIFVGSGSDLLGHSGFRSDFFLVILEMDPVIQILQ